MHLMMIIHILNFGNNLVSIKMGVIEDISNRSKLAKLLRFKTSKSGDKFVSLDQYLVKIRIVQFL